MNDDRNEADRILGEDRVMPGYRRFLEAWEKHPQGELLDERKGETQRAEQRDRVLAQHQLVVGTASGADLRATKLETEDPF